MDPLVPSVLTWTAALLMVSGLAVLIQNPPLAAAAVTLVAMVVYIASEDDE